VLVLAPLLSLLRLTVFEAKLVQGSLLKKIVESIRELVTDANVDCSETGISMQAMDSSHVSLVTLNLRNDGFDHFRCDRNLSLGLNLLNLSKILKCAGNDDSITLRCEDDSDTLTATFESKSEFNCLTLYDAAAFADSCERQL
jgi:proliferating cell nuclear antigen